MKSILDTKIQFFPGKIWKSSPIGKVSLSKMIEAIKNPKENIKETFNKIAKAEKEEDWETKGKLKQNNLYYFTPCANFDGKSRGYKNIESFNGLMVLDFDHIKVNAEKLRDNIFDNMGSVVTAFVSPSKNGVKCILRIPVVKTVDEFKSYFYGVAYEFQDFKGFDVSCKNPALPLFISWDKNIRYRENPLEYKQRGGMYNEFEEYNGEVEEIDNITNDDKKEVLRRLYNIIKKADKEQVGHPNVVSTSILAGGFIPFGYITYEEVKNYIFKWIDESDYLSNKSSTYKKTAKQMITKGTKAPVSLEKHKDKAEKYDLPDLKKENKKGYYLLCNYCKNQITKNERKSIKI